MEGLLKFVIQLKIDLLLHHLPENLQQSMMFPRRMSAHDFDDVMNGFNGRQAIDVRLLADQKFGRLRRVKHDLRQGLKAAALPIHGPRHAPGRIQNDEHSVMSGLGTGLFPGGNVLSLGTWEEQIAALLGILDQVLKRLMIIKIVACKQLSIFKVKKGHASGVYGLTRFLGMQQDDELWMAGKRFYAAAVAHDVRLPAVQAESSWHGPDLFDCLKIILVTGLYTVSRLSCLVPRFIKSEGALSSGVLIGLNVAMFSQRTHWP